MYSSSDRCYLKKKKEKKYDLQLKDISFNIRKRLSREQPDRSISHFHLMWDIHKQFVRLSACTRERERAAFILL